MTEFIIPMTLTFHSIVTVEADDAEEAVRKAKEETDFIDDGLSGASLVDWKVTGRATEA